MVGSLFTDIKTALEGEGYLVNTSPQEKNLREGKELNMIIKDIDITVESSYSYIVDVMCSITMYISKSIDVITIPIALMTIIEEGVTMTNNFAFTKPDITLFGTLYRVDLNFTFKEVVTVNTEE